MDPRSRWSALWQALGAAADMSLFATLQAAYTGPHRHYHTLQHLEECFVHFEELKHLALRPDEVEVALWFHDAIYDTRRQDNEQLSARWAAQVLSAVSREAAGRVGALILATRHEALPEGIDAQILVDVDLAILGADKARFDEYEAQVRREYAWVPGLVYRRGRRRILESFLARAAIYSTENFLQRLEGRARANLARSLARL